MISSNAINDIVKNFKKSPTQIGFIKKHDDAKKPVRAKKGDVGFDLCSVEKVSLYAQTDPVPIDTGIAIELPNHLFALIAPRSGLGKKGITIHGGVIDAGYRGNIIVLVSKTGPGFVDVEVGDKIAQLLILPKFDVEFEEVKMLSESERGANGFGSTDFPKSN